MFRSTTMTPLDALLTEVAHRTVDFLKGQAQDVTLARVLADFRRQYCIDSPPRPAGDHRVRDDSPGRNRSCRTQPSSRHRRVMISTPELTDAEKNAVAQRMANRHVPNHNEAISDGRFWAYADFRSLRGLFSRHPELFLDGKYWEDPYETLDHGASEVTEDAKAGVLSRYDAYLGDAVWLANQTPADLDGTSRDTIIRAACSLRLLRSDVVE